MPRRQPFTRLCQTAAKLFSPSRADLHAHTTASDGDCTPSQLVVLARNAGLAALAITDHDTTAGLPEARETASSFQSKPLEVVAGVEISTHHAGRTYHLLGYCFEKTHWELQKCLTEIRHRRRERFISFIEAFSRRGAKMEPHRLDPLLNGDVALGRRHLAMLLVASGHAATTHLAFQKFLLPERIPDAHSVPLDRAIALILDAGGVTSLAHPPESVTRDDLFAMQSLGLDAIEVNYPAATYGITQTLTQWAKELNLAVTAGSDYHGGNQVLGSRTVGADQLLALRNLARCSGSAAAASQSVSAT